VCAQGRVGPVGGPEQAVPVRVGRGDPGGRLAQELWCAAGRIPYELGCRGSDCPFADQPVRGVGVGDRVVAWFGDAGEAAEHVVLVVAFPVDDQPSGVVVFHLTDGFVGSGDRGEPVAVVVGVRRCGAVAGFGEPVPGRVVRVVQAGCGGAAGVLGTPVGELVLGVVDRVVLDAVLDDPYWVAYLVVLVGVQVQDRRPISEHDLGDAPQGVEGPFLGCPVRVLGQHLVARLVVLERDGGVVDGDRGEQAVVCVGAGGGDAGGGGT